MDETLRAIRLRDRDAERCGASGCEMPYSQETHHTPPEPGCLAPEDHHPFVPSGQRYGTAEDDRHYLLRVIERIAQRQSLWRLAFEDRHNTRAMLHEQAAEFEHWLNEMTGPLP